ncbi:MAG: CehA/McbA family metallohydrolase [Pirellulales bacterium]
MNGIVWRRVGFPIPGWRPRWAVGMVVFVVWLGGGRASLAAEPSGDPPEKLAVEGQPLAANVQRLLEAWRYLGVPPAEALREPLQAAIDARDATRIQDVLDEHVLLTVAINPETRVKVRRGPARAELQQGGFTPVLVKILNESTSTQRIRMTSPQGGAAYGGASRFSLERQQQVELFAAEPAARADRFLAVEWFGQPPLTARLSGLEVEYGLGLIFSSEAGSREATIGFDLGQGTQDLGFRGEVPVLFRIRPAVPVVVEVRDHDGSATVARLEIRDSQGRVYPPQARRLAPDFFFQPHIYRADGQTVWLPPGEFTVQSSRGPEYVVERQTLVVAPEAAAGREPVRLPVRLRRWIDPAAQGFYSGDHHIHGAGCAHYTSPSEGVLPAHMFQQVKGEGLNVGCVLTWGPCFRFQRQFFEPQPHGLSEPRTILKYDLEISGFGSQALGHVCLLNLRDQTFPGSNGLETEGWPTWTLPVMRWAKEQGGVTGYAHAASGLHIDPQAAARRLREASDRDGDAQVSAAEAASALLPEAFATIDADQSGALDEQELRRSHERARDELPNLAIPEMNGVGAMEIFVTVPARACDFISAMDTRRIQEWNTWYHLLNCGFPLKVSGETDFPCMSSRQVGQGRVYVQLGNVERLDFANWCAGLARGASYVSDGYAHAVDFQVADRRPGEAPVSLSQRGPVVARARVAFAPATPRTVAQGLVAAPGQRHLLGDTVELHGPRIDDYVTGGERVVELLRNGRVVAERRVPADGQLHELEWTVDVEASSWLALRQFPQLHTNPVEVRVADQPIRASRASARWCLACLDLLWQNRQRNIAAAERPDAERAYAEARRTFQQIAAESP